MRHYKSKASLLFVASVFAILAFDWGIASAATFNPTFLDFGPSPGTTTDPMTITFTNNTGGPIELTDAAITGANPDDFLFALLDPNDCVVTAKGPDSFNDLQDGESCDLQIKFHPTGAGARSATLSISYNDEFGNPQVLTADLTGEGTAHECDPDLDGTAGNGGRGQIIENSIFDTRVLQRINEATECESGDPVSITQTTFEFDFGCDVVIFGTLYDWPNIIVADGTLIVNVTETTTEIQYLCVATEGGEGCTPGYWKQSHHFDSWTAPFTPNTLFSNVFENAFPGKTLLQVLRQGGGDLKALGRHTVAALLNAASSNVDYDLSTGEVINLFNEVFPGNKTDYNDLKDAFEDFNEQGCPLN